MRKKIIFKRIFCFISFNLYFHSLCFINLKRPIFYFFLKLFYSFSFLSFFRNLFKISIGKNIEFCRILGRLRSAFFLLFSLPFSNTFQKHFFVSSQRLMIKFCKNPSIFSFNIVLKSFFILLLFMLLLKF